jgi:hypothetical protein
MINDDYFIFTFCAFFPLFISNTSIVSINFGANLDAQNAGKDISGIQKFSGGVLPQTSPSHSCVVYWSHTWPSAIAIPPLIYYLTERSLFKKCPPPHGKILKKGPGLEWPVEYWFLAELQLVFV